MKDVSSRLMPAILATAVFAGLPASAVQAETPVGTGRDLAFDHVNVVDVKTGDLLTDMTVVLTGDRISDMGKSGQVKTANTQVINATGKFLIPGLWDMHTHILGQPETYYPQLLTNGITGIRDMGSFLWDFERMRQEKAEGKLMPEVVSGGTTVDGKPAPFRTYITSPAEGRHAVQSLKKRGVDFIKIYEFFTRDEYFAIADEAKRQGLSYVGHLPYGVTMAEASDAGQKSLEHFYAVFMNTSDQGEEIRDSLQKFDVRSSELLFHGAQQNIKALDSYNEEKAQALYAKFVKNGTYITPTFVDFRNAGLIGTEEYQNFQNDPRLQYIPTSQQMEWKNAADFWLANDLHKDTLKALYQQYEQGLGYMKKMHDAGVPILAGTDTAPYEVLYIYPGSALHDELEIFVQAGLTPVQALQTATINPAKYLGRENEMGTVEKDKEADLVLLNANPLTDINNIRQIDSVVVDGRLLDRNKLDSIQAEVKAKVDQQQEPTLVHIRRLEQLGYQVDWDGIERKVTVSKGDTTLLLKIGSNIINYNGDNLTLWGPVQITNDRTFVELKMLNGLLGLTLQP